MNQNVKYLIIVLFLLLIIIPPQVFGEDEHKTVIVGRDETFDYISIQQAIWDANENDTIFITNGTYYETLTIPCSLKLTGESRNETIIDGNGQDIVIMLNASNIIIENLTIRNSGNVFPNAGITIKTTGNTITNNRLIENYYGIVLLYPTAYNLISNNFIADNNQCGIYFSGAKYNMLKGNFVDSQPFNGFGLYDFSDYNKIINNTLSHNQYCGVNIRDSFYNTVTSNTFIENRVGLHVPPPECQTTKEKNMFYGNTVDIEEERDLVIYTLITAVILMILGFFIYKRRIM